ncbi:MAG: hypothetical protein H6619_05010 [Deltaproteobacteria bacterium]|nr:hypothetical protein [Deltaproteobacteria bacterium]
MVKGFIRLGLLVFLSQASLGFCSDDLFELNDGASMEDEMLALDPLTSEEFCLTCPKESTAVLWNGDGSGAHPETTCSDWQAANSGGKDKAIEDLAKKKGGKSELCNGTCRGSRKCLATGLIHSGTPLGGDPEYERRTNEDGSESIRVCVKVYDTKKRSYYALCGCKRESDPADFPGT